MRKQGFTLIELLIVVAIIAILAAIAVPNFLEAQVRSKVSRCKADMRSLATALEAYRIDQPNYPPMFDSGWAGGVWPTTTEPPFHSRIPNYLTTPVAFITSLPHDPFNDFKQWLTWAIGTDINQRFVYYNYPYYLEAFPTDIMRNRANDAGYWLFYSPGPDLRWYNEPANSVYINYDSTNGTNSLGNIFRTQRTTDLYIRGNW